jgi:hypothetical protein
MLVHPVVTHPVETRCIPDHPSQCSLFQQHRSTRPPISTLCITLSPPLVTSPLFDSYQTPRSKLEHCHVPINSASAPLSFSAVHVSPLAIVHNGTAPLSNRVLGTSPPSSVHSAHDAPTPASFNATLSLSFLSEPLHTPHSSLQKLWGDPYLVFFLDPRGGGRAEFAMMPAAVHVTVLVLHLSRCSLLS